MIKFNINMIIYIYTMPKKKNEKMKKYLTFYYVFVIIKHNKQFILFGNF
jgi:hypothetical protein